MRLRLLVLFLLAALGGCADTPPECGAEAMPPDDAVWLVAHGWHTDLAIPAAELRGNMAFFREAYPGLRVLMVGFGKRTFMMAPVTTSGDLLIGPFPGSGTLLVVGLTAPPERAYADGTQTLLTLPPGGVERLSGFIWETLQIADGRPVAIGKSSFPGGVFYATRTEYSGFNTCNTWAIDALQAAGVDVSSLGVVFAGQAFARAAAVSGGACTIHNAP